MHNYTKNQLYLINLIVMELYLKHSSYFSLSPHDVAT